MVHVAVAITADVAQIIVTKKDGRKRPFVKVVVTRGFWTVGQLKPQKNVYAVIDLGSNSFHMLIAKSIAGGLQTIGRVKRKVRLAAGLDKDNVLSTEAMQRGWECLALFAERLQDIPDKNITIVATATLRLATNA